MDDLYHQEILDHYHNPDNFGKLDHPDKTIEETNASCGDSFTFYAKINPQTTIIDDISFTGTGCAISTAASSLLTTHLKGKLVSEVKKIDLDFMQKLLGTEITPMRIKCLLLPAKALSKLV